MKKIIIFSLVFVLFSSPFVFAERPLGLNEFSSVDELAGAIAAYFPKIQGDVKAIQGNQVTISLNRKDGLTPGMELTMWRDGKELVHPVTGVVIGRQEDEVGVLEVLSVGDASSTGTLKKKLKEPKAGDRVRITPKKINLAIIPLRSDRPEIAQMLSQRLTEYGRFTVLDHEKTAEFLKDRKQHDTSLVREMGSRFGIDAVVALGIYPSDGKYLVTARIFYAEDARTLDTIIAALDLKSKKDALGDIKPFFVPVEGDQNVTAELPFDARYFVAGDFEGNGKVEYAFSDGSKLHIYRHEPGGWREVWTELPSSGLEGIQHINLDAADINGNGRPEIFVTAMVNGRIFSSVVEFKDDTFHRIADLPCFLRVIRYPGKQMILLGQDYDPAVFYSGPPKIYSWTDGKYVAGADFPLPKGLAFYGFTFADFGEAEPLIAGLDEDDHLRVYSKNTVIWKSEEQYPAVDTYVYKPVTGISAALSKEVREKEKNQRVRISGRVIAIDANGGGRDEIILPKNISSSFFGGFKEAEMKGLRWTGARLEQRWNIGNISGPVLDYQVIQDAAGKQIIALVRTKGSLFTKDRQQVVSYPLK